MEATLLQSIASPTIVTATLVSNIIFVAFLIAYNVSGDVERGAKNYLKKNITLVLFVVSATAFVGSLAYSNIVGFPPCELCWWTRILMYPQVLLTACALWKKDSNIVNTLLPLSVLGFLLTLYHSFILWGGKSILPCTQEGAACSKLYVMEYGYITIPVMALSCFVYLLTATYIYKKF
ncbi:MAG: disulfide bond formation protein B [Candidatus Zambryskibacteria bacterium]|nr:disulfide bond formation protein B [Candidatus Zambryskibacteria bacterium]